MGSKKMGSGLALRHTSHQYELFKSPHSKRRLSASPRMIAKLAAFVEGERYQVLHSYILKVAQVFSRILSGLLVAIAVTLLACSETTFNDVSSKSGYRELVGTSYTVIGSLDAYGIRKHSQAAAEYATLIPTPGIAGSEVGFRIPIAVGTKMTVTRVYETNRFFDSSISLEVKIFGGSVPENLPIRVDLMRGNQGSNKLSLNPEIFRKN